MDTVLQNIASIMLRNDNISALNINQDVLYIQPCTREILRDVRRAVVASGSNLDEYRVGRNRNLPDWFKTCEVRRRTEEEKAEREEELLRKIEEVWG